MRDLPSGTVTFLFTDIEGSTRLIEALGEEGYVDALVEHRRVLREAFGRHEGVEVDTQGDAFLYAFPGAGTALAAAEQGQRALASGPVRVRMGLHTGEPLSTGEGYAGRELHRAARIAAAGHGDQVVVSETTAALVPRSSLRDLGAHRLKDLLEPTRLYQLEIEGLRGEFPPLRSLHQTNLPVAAWPLLGREPELEKVRELLAEGARLVTLTGVGGSGKTRLGLQAAAELSDEFADGVFFVPLAPLRELAAVRGTVAEAVGLQPDDDLVAWLGTKRILLVLDNLEHLPGVEQIVAELLVGDVVVLATSRGPLHLSTEHELPVDPLPSEAAVELFVSRAEAAGRRIEADETVREVCERLDNLPLAVELAAARAKLLSPTALLKRLDATLPLLSGGARDLPERQRTLRATIEWSHDLLGPDAQAAFRRLSVFRGSFILDAAEAVAGADLDLIALLLDQSLLRSLAEERMFLLETLREFAREQLDNVGETDAYTLRHARWYLGRLEDSSAELLGRRRSEPLAWIGVEMDNLRAMLARLARADPREGARAAHLMSRFWSGRGAFSEAKQWLELFVPDGDLGPERVPLLFRLCQVEMELGNYDAAEIAGREAYELAEVAGDRSMLVDLLSSFAALASRRGNQKQAIELAKRALDEAETIGDETQAITLMHLLGSFLGKAQRSDEAMSMIRSTNERARRSGDQWAEMASSLNLGWMALYTSRDYQSARAAFETVLERNREFDNHSLQTNGLLGLGFSLLGLKRHLAARTAFAELFELLIEAGQTHGIDLTSAASGIALAAESSQYRAAARLRGAVATLRHEADYEPEPNDIELERIFEQQLIDAVGQNAWEHESAAGATMNLEQTLSLARLLAEKSSESEISPDEAKNVTIR